MGKQALDCPKLRIELLWDSTDANDFQERPGRPNMCKMKPYVWIMIVIVAAFALTAAIELAMGRLVFGPDGTFGWWEGDVWSSELSQRFADPYSLSHIAHGLLFYGLLWLVMRRVPVRCRLCMAVLMEVIWEILENSPLIINRYREMTMALGYTGDSVLNSLSDILMMALGFILASRSRVWVSVAILLVFEIGMLLWVRDNLTLNIIMLIHPIEAIKTWQMSGHAIP